MSASPSHPAPKRLTRALGVLALFALSAPGCSLLFAVDDYDARPAVDASMVATDAGPDVSRPPCTDARPVYRVRKPETGDNLYTMTLSEAVKAKSDFGYTEDFGTVFRGYPILSARVVPLYRLSNPATRLHFWTVEEEEKPKAAALGFSADEGISAYVIPISGDCGVPVYRLERSGAYILTISDGERKTLVADGWTDQGIRFFAGTP